MVNADRERQCTSLWTVRIVTHGFAARERGHRDFFRRNAWRQTLGDDIIARTCRVTLEAMEAADAMAASHAKELLNDSTRRDSRGGANFPARGLVRGAMTSYCFLRDGSQFAGISGERLNVRGDSK
jgi:hypothetical protein